MKTAQLTLGQIMKQNIEACKPGGVPLMTLLSETSQNPLFAHCPSQGLITECGRVDFYANLGINQKENYFLVTPAICWPEQVNEDGAKIFRQPTSLHLGRIRAPGPLLGALVREVWFSNLNGNAIFFQVARELVVYKIKEHEANINEHESGEREKHNAKQLGDYRQMLVQQGKLDEQKLHEFQDEQKRSDQRFLDQDRIGHKKYRDLLELLDQGRALMSMSTDGSGYWIGPTGVISPN